jgi:hypothetical protein
MIDKIIITGSSDSTGMEIMDHLLGYPSQNTRRSAIWKWYKENYKDQAKGLSIEKLDHLSDQSFHDIERKHSWPALLEKETGIPVINLSMIGSSIGRNLLEFSNYCKENKVSDQTIAIHQLPISGRFYIKFKNQRINICPSDNFDDLRFLNNLGYNKKYFKEDIKELKQKYKTIIKKDISYNYIEKYYNRCLKRIEKVGNRYGIKSFFISQKNIHINNKLIENFDEFKNRYKKGSGGHPIDPNFNKDLVEIIKTKII